MRSGGMSRSTVRTIAPFGKALWAPFDCARDAPKTEPNRVTASRRVSFFASVHAKIISDHLSIFHDEPHTLELVNVGEGIAGDGDKIGKCPRLDRANAVLPTKHLSGVGGDGSDDIERLHPGVAQLQQRRHAGLAARLAG